MLRAVQMCHVPPLLPVKPEIPPGLAVAIETALEPVVGHRWENAAELAHALLAVDERRRRVAVEVAPGGDDGAPLRQRRRRAASWRPATAPTEATSANASGGR